jgi:hypothetical protein
MPVIGTKLVNALVEDAEFAPGGGVRAAMDAADAADSVGFVVRRFKSAYGGLWVGARLTLTDTELTFEPNRVNRAVHKDLAVVTVPLAAVAGVEVQPGFVTKIIAIRTGNHVFKARCYGARRFADQITKALPR